LCQHRRLRTTKTRPAPFQIRSPPTTTSTTAPPTTRTPASTLLTSLDNIMHDHLIAPRPVRIASNPIIPYSGIHNIRRTTPIRSPVASISLVSPPSDSFARLKLDAGGVETTDSIVTEDDIPRYSPGVSRSPMTLPPETLEEFLSILRPSVMPFQTFNKYPTSPVRRQHRNRSSIPALPPFTSSGFISGGLSSPDSTQDRPPSGEQQPQSDEMQDSPSTANELDINPAAWRGSGLLSSPVSRNHTMNPFARHPDHENLALTLRQNTYPPPSPTQGYHYALSPTMVPLPPSTSPPPCILEHREETI